jgi:hypothetical protein
MNLVDTILTANGGGAVTHLANRFGLSDAEATAVIQNLLPGIAAGLHRNIGEGGLSDLVGALNTGNHQQYLDDPAALSSEATTEEGNNILGHILGSKDVSRKIAANASTRTGIGEDILKRMLPIVATMAMGALSKRASDQSTPNMPGASAGILGMLTPLLDRNRDGSITDDLLGGLFRKRTG